MKVSSTIVLTGGGSGGHITPLLSLAQELKKLEPNCEIVYIGFKGDRFDELKESSANFDFVSFIDGGKFRRYHGESFMSHVLDIKTVLLNIPDFFKVINSVFKAYRILRKVNPDVVFSKGGFVVVPVGIAARLQRIPIITHDSDTIPGLANRIVGRWAKINATGMPAEYYEYPSERIEYVGVPVKEELKQYNPKLVQKLKREHKIPIAAQVLLVAGGGNGSKKLNDLTTSMAPVLLAANPSLFLVHICGQMHVEEVKKSYSVLLDSTEVHRIRVMGFTPEFANYEKMADLIVSRAGATSIAEYAMLAKPAIIIPSPFLAGGHQLKNAEQLQKHDAAVVVDEQTSNEEVLELIQELLHNSKRRDQLSENIAGLAKPNATKELAQIILKTRKAQA